ncbi:Alpha-1,6-mannosyl-glycoprotein 6-beta-N-acetylglucosaminyltransferase [Aphelenchoides fujianensis]|nr:Alpha-1,6-mannosyl-glycoprotein 6-beta-N-acetylglucosaminyltransferase [Aphelenchoides fujianensis]
MCVRQLRRHSYLVVFVFVACALIGFQRLQLVTDDEASGHTAGGRLFGDSPLNSANNGVLTGGGDSILKQTHYCGLSVAELANNSAFPQCLHRLEWLRGGWRSHECYARFGVNGSECSFYDYMARREHHCPPPPADSHWRPRVEEFVADRVKPTAQMEELFARMRDSAESYEFMQSRIRRLWPEWTEAKRVLETNRPAVAHRRTKTLYLYLGFLNVEKGRMNFVKVAKSGGPLGEMVQWADLMAAAHVLGYDVHVFTVWAEARRALSQRQQQAIPCPDRNATSVDLIFTDIMGLMKIKRQLKSFYVDNWCRFRVLDSFGTHAEFNQPQYFKANYKRFGSKVKSNPWGGHALNLQQFLTLYPHTDDNTFLGFVVETQPFGSQEIARENLTVVYGKDASMWVDSAPVLEVAARFTEIHGTVLNYSAASRHAQREFENHGVLSPLDFSALLRRAKIFLGLGFPIEGPAPLEAVANGAIFINPRFEPPKSRTTYKFFSEKPTMRKITSQNPYMERFVGRPFVITVDIRNATELAAAFEEALRLNPKPTLPYEFSFVGMLERVDAILTNLDVCERDSDWPPFARAGRVLVGAAGQSCQDACRANGFLCERSFFKRINNAETVKRHFNCSTALQTIAEPHAPSECALQSDAYLFSCATEPPADVRRLCPCRTFNKQQTIFFE